MAQRAIVFGIDGLILPLVEHLIGEGRLPNFGRMFREGALTQVLPFVSTWGPINWMCFATGASPGTVWRGTVKVPGLDRPLGGQQGAYFAETLWRSLERQGKSSAIIAYPACWPPTISDGIVAVPDRSSTDLFPVEIARPARYMTEGFAQKYRRPPGTRAGWIPLTSRHREAQSVPFLATPHVPVGWRNLPAGDLLATTLPIYGTNGQTLCELGLLLHGVRGSRPQVRVCMARDGGQELVRLSVGNWSDWALLSFPATGKEGFVRFKLLETLLGSQAQVVGSGREVAICHSQIYPRTDFAYPRGIEHGLIGAAGPYACGSSAQPTPGDPFWRTSVEEAAYEGRWLVGAAKYLADKGDWSLFMTVFRPVDAANHGCLAYTDADFPHYGGPETATRMDILAETYTVADDILGAFMGMADDDTVVAVASDHGAVVNRVTCDIYNLLLESGLLAIEEESGCLVVDWARTRAYIRPTRSGSEVFINLAGREPHGIVGPADYEQVQERVIDLLLDWREPETGRRAIALALKHRDSALLGYWGTEAGDVQFIYNSGFVWGELPLGVTSARTAVPSVNHGPQIPTAEKGLTSNMGMFALWGPGVSKGYRRPGKAGGPARMCDPAPTIAHLLGCAPPADNEGSVLRDMLDD